MRATNSKRHQYGGDDKDIIIAQMNAELFETKKRYNNYVNLKAKFVELEHCFKKLQDEKRLTEISSINKQDELTKNYEKLGETKRMLTKEIEENIKEAEKKCLERDEYKEKVEEQNVDLSRIRSELNAKSTFKQDFTQSRKYITEQISSETDKSYILQKELDRLINENERLSNTIAKTDEKIQNALLTSHKLNKTIDSRKAQISELRSMNPAAKQHNENIAEIKAAQAKAAEISSQNKVLIEKNKEMAISARDLELRLNRLEQRINENENHFEIKRKEAESAGAELTELERKQETVQSDLYKERAKNQILKKQVEEHRVQANQQKQIKEDMFMRSLELSQKNKDLRKMICEQEIEKISGTMTTKTQSTFGLLKSHTRLMSSLKKK